MEKLSHIRIEEIVPNPYQPRKEFDPIKLEELAESIKENGLIQPIIVRQSPILGYELLAGERRLRACKLAQLKEVPVIIKDLNDQEMRLQAIIENLQREDLNPIEEALSYQSLVDRGMKHDQIAKTIGKSRPYISNSLRLLQLSPLLQKAVKDLTLSPGHARLLLPLKKEEQEAWLERIQKEDLSVRKLEGLLSGKKTRVKRKKNLFIQEEMEKLEKILGSQVDIRLQTNQSGSIKISFKDEEEYQRIIHFFKD